MAGMILSPHFDDAVLSCWHLLDAGGDIRVVNVFAGVPPPDRAAGWWDAIAGVQDSSEAVLQRRLEDEAALALAGRAAINLGFLDDQYRVHPQPIEPVIEQLRPLISAADEVFAPAALLLPR